MPPYARNAHMIDRSQVLRAVQQDIENSDLSEQNKRYLLRLIRVDPDYFYEFIDDTIESHRKAPPPQPSAAPPSAPQPSAAAPAEASSPAVEKAKANVIRMVSQLAELPPPEAEEDNIGFSRVTDRPLRSFLARLSTQGDLPLADFHRAALLLIEHSRTQLDRKTVMSTIRAFEKALMVPPDQIVSENATRAPESAKRIYDPVADNVSRPGIGEMRWSISADGMTVTLRIPTKKRKEEEGLDLKEVADAAKTVNAKAKMTILATSEGHYSRNLWGLSLPVQTIPVAAAVIGKYIPEYGEILMALWPSWREVLPPEGIAAAEQGKPWPPIADRPAEPEPELDPSHGSIGFGLLRTSWVYDKIKPGKIEIAFPYSQDREQYTEKLKKQGILPLSRARLAERTYTDKYGDQKTAKDYFYTYSTSTIPAVIELLRKMYPDDRGKDQVIRSLQRLMPNWRNPSRRNRGRR